MIGKPLGLKLCSKQRSKTTDKPRNQIIGSLSIFVVDVVLVLYSNLIVVSENSASEYFVAQSIGSQTGAGNCGLESD